MIFSWKNYPGEIKVKFKVGYLNAMFTSSNFTNIIDLINTLFHVINFFFFRTSKKHFWKNKVKWLSQEIWSPRAQSTSMKIFTEDKALFLLIRKQIHIQNSDCCHHYEPEAKQQSTEW